MRKIYITTGIGISLTILVLLISYQWITDEEEGPVTFMDYPYVLSDEVDTIKVTYVAWACACANWLPTDSMKNSDYRATEMADDCIFIEAERKK